MFFNTLFYLGCLVRNFFTTLFYLGCYAISFLLLFISVFYIFIDAAHGLHGLKRKKPNNPTQFEKSES